MKFDALDMLTGQIPPYPAREDQPEVLAVRQFAADNGYEYQVQSQELVAYSWHDYKSMPAWMGLVGMAATKDAYNVVTGEYRNYPFRMFSMWDNLTDGVQYKNPTEEQKRKYVKQQTTGIVRVRLPKSFPQVVLDSNKNDRFQSSIRTEYNSSQRLQLEGDFPEYFDVYAPVGLQVNVLTLLAPNLMQILKDSSGLFDVEFNGNEMIIMTRASLYDPAVMHALAVVLDEQLAYLDRLIPSWEYTPRQQPIDRLSKPFVVGTPMKIGRLRLSATVQLILIALGFAAFAVLILLAKR